MGSRKMPRSFAMITGSIRRGQISLALSLITLLAFSAVLYSVNAADGDLDLSFGTLGKVTTDFSGGAISGMSGGAVALQSDGKIVVAGTTQIYLPNPDFALARYNSDGTLDTSFGGDGVVTTDFSGGTDWCVAVALQSDGKIIAVGYYWGYFKLARYNSDGTLDTSFGGNGKVTTDLSGDAYTAQAVALQSDGKIVVAGTSAQADGNIDFALARFNSDGTLDTSFSADGKVSTDFSGNQDWAGGVALQSDGKIVVVGWSAQVNAQRFALARYNSDGSLDDGTAADSTPADLFGSLGKATTAFSAYSDSAYAVALQSDGKIIAVGECGCGGWDFALARYNSDGTLDASFSEDGKVTTDFSGGFDLGEGVVLQSDGQIVVAGRSGQAGTDYDFALVRYNSDGTLDTSFSADGKVTTDFSGGSDLGRGLVLQRDGKIIVAGTSAQGFALARYEGNSSVQVKINDIITAINGSNLPAGTETSLNAKLWAALAALQTGDTAAACSSLQDFLNYVRAQRGKNIPEPEADALTDSVTQIRAELGCP